MPDPSKKGLEGWNPQNRKPAEGGGIDLEEGGDALVMLERSGGGSKTTA